MGHSTTVQMSEFAHRIMEKKYSHTKPSGHKETWEQIALRQAECIIKPHIPELTNKTKHFITERKVIPGGRYLYAAGRRFQQIANCFLFRAQDSREGWGELCNKTANALMTGGGVGVVYTPVRPFGYTTKGMGGEATGPCSLMGIVNEQGRRIMQGGSRRSAIWAGLHWWHPDVFRLIGAKNWPEVVRKLKAEDYNFPAELDMTNISVIIDNDFFAAIHNKNWMKKYTMWGITHEVDHAWAKKVFDQVTYGMVTSAEPGFSVDVDDNEGEDLRNACTEVTSRDDGDMCNLVCVNMARCESIEEFYEAVELATGFAVSGTLAGVLPMKYMEGIREKNRRIGIGLMGVHEWLLKRGYRYSSNRELKAWMEAYTTSTQHANQFCDRLGISRPVATRSIAPTGTISIVGETTSGIEPIYATAMKRRFLDGTTWKAQYIVDPTAYRLIQGGMDPNQIEDSGDLAKEVHRRVEFQSFMQRYVDHAISSTVNLPEWGSEHNNEDTLSNFRKVLLSELPRVRGITAYPDGSRSGQPLTRVPYSEVMGRIGVEFEDGSEHGCRGGLCNS